MAELLPSQTPQGVPGDFLNVSAATPAAFGSEVGRAVEKSGNEVLTLLNENAATELQTATGQKLAERWGQYQRLQGKAAIDGAPAYLEDVRQIQKDALDSAPNLKIRTLSGQGLTYLADRSFYQGQNHADAELKRYTVQVDTNAGNFNYDQMASAILEGDDLHASQTMAAGDDSYMHLHHDVQGLDPVLADQETSKVRSAYIKDAIGQVLKTEPERGLALYEKYKGRINAGAEYSLLTGVIDAKGKVIAQQSLTTISNSDAGFVDGIPNKQAWLTEAAKISANPAERAKAFSEINNQYEQYSQGITAHREIINKEFPNLIQAAKDDPDHVVFPRAEVRAFYPGEVADYMEREFNTAKAIGAALQQVPTATPETLATIRKSLETGTGVTSDQLRMKLQSKAIADPGAITIPNGSNADTEFQKMKDQAIGQFNRMVEVRNKALVEDPAGMAWGAPSVKAAAEHINPDDPNSVTSYLQSVKAQQAVYGVPDNDQRVIPRKVAQDMAKQIVNSPNPAQTVISLQRQWGGRDKNGEIIPGGFADQLLDDIVTLGKLPTAYEAIATLMDNPNHPDSSDLLAKGLKTFTGEKATQVEKFMPAEAKNGIDKAIMQSPTISKMIMSFGAQNMNPARQSALIDSVKMLAYSELAFNGAQGSEDAAKRAIDAFTDDLTFMGNAAVPNQYIDAVQVKTREFLKLGGMGGLSILAPLVGDPARKDFIENTDIMVPPGLDKETYLSTLRAAPLWVNSPDGKGLNLIGPLGGTVRDKAGKPVVIPFKDEAPNKTAVDKAKTKDLTLEPASKDQPVGTIVPDPRNPGQHFEKLPNGNWARKMDAKPVAAVTEAPPVAAPTGRTTPKGGPGLN